MNEHRQYNKYTIRNSLSKLFELLYSILLKEWAALLSLGRNFPVTPRQLTLAQTKQKCSK